MFGVCVCVCVDMWLQRGGRALCARASLVFMSLWVRECFGHLPYFVFTVSNSQCHQTFCLQKFFGAFWCFLDSLQKHELFHVHWATMSLWPMVNSMHMISNKQAELSICVSGPCTPFHAFKHKIVIIFLHTKLLKHLDDVPRVEQHGGHWSLLAYRSHKKIACIRDFTSHFYALETRFCCI